MNLRNAEWIFFDMGYTLVDLMQVMVHPMYASWCYQVTGYYAPTSRYGTPEDFKYFVDTMHNAGIGVNLDWVPGHFPKDDHGLRCFDGTPLYEGASAPPQDQWGTLPFDFSCPMVRQFLTATAQFWHKEFQLDGLRVDALSSIL